MEGDQRLAGRISAGLDKKASGRRFGLSVGVAFLVLTAVLMWRDHRTAMTVTGSIGAVLVLGGFLTPTLLFPVERAWMAMAHAISKVTTPIFLGIVFFLVVTPIGMVVRVFSGSPLRHKGSGDRGFWFPTAEDEAKRGGMTRQF